MKSQAAVGLVLGGIVGIVGFVAVMWSPWDARRDPRTEHARESSGPELSVSSNPPDSPLLAGRPPVPKPPVPRVPPPGQVPIPEGCAPDVDRPPRLVFDLPSEGLDLGNLKQGQAVLHVVTFRNDGQGTLCLLTDAPKTGCGCLKATFVGAQRRFEPGERGSIELRLDTTGREGRQRKSVQVFTNDRVVPLSSFDVRANVSVGVVVSGAQIQFARAGKGMPSKATVRLKSPKDEDWTVTEVVALSMRGGAESPQLTFSVTDVSDPERRVVDLEITHPGRSEPGIFAHPVEIHTTHPHRPVIQMQSYLEVVAPVVAFPPRVNLGFAEPGRKQKVWIVPGQVGIDFEVTGVGVEPEDAGFTATFGRPQEGVKAIPGTWWVEVQYQDGSRDPGPLEAILVVSLRHPELQELRLPITATVRARH